MPRLFRYALTVLLPLHTYIYSGSFKPTDTILINRAQERGPIEGLLGQHVKTVLFDSPTGNCMNDWKQKKTKQTEQSLVSLFGIDEVDEHKGSFSKSLPSDQKGGVGVDGGAGGGGGGAGGKGGGGGGSTRDVCQPQHDSVWKDETRKKWKQRCSTPPERRLMYERITRKALRRLPLHYFTGSLSAEPAYRFLPCLSNRGATEIGVDKSQPRSSQNTDVVMYCFFHVWFTADTTPHSLPPAMCLGGRHEGSTPHGLGLVWTAGGARRNVHSQMVDRLISLLFVWHGGDGLADKSDQ